MTSANNAEAASATGHWMKPEPMPSAASMPTAYPPIPRYAAWPKLIIPP